MHEKFETTDVNLATTIVATIGAPLVLLDRSDSLRLVFAFNKEDVPEEFVEAYWNGQLRVEPMIFVAAQRYLSRRIQEGPIGEAE